MPIERVIRKLTPLLVLVIVGCHHRSRMQTSIPPAVGDSISLISVVQSHGNKLERGTPVELFVTIQYTLSTREQAVFVLDLDQFSTRETCAIPEEASIGIGQRLTVATQAIPITLGTHTLEVRITWPGGSGQGEKYDRASGAGALSLRASMRTEKPEYSFLTYRFGTQYCMQF